MVTERVFARLEMGADFETHLELLAASRNLSKGEILGRAMALYDVVVEAKNRGCRVVVLDEEAKAIKEIVGL